MWQPDDDEYWVELQQEWKQDLKKRFGTYSHDAYCGDDACDGIFIAVGDVDKMLDDIYTQIDTSRLL